MKKALTLICLLSIGSMSAMLTRSTTLGVQAYRAYGAHQDSALTLKILHRRYIQTVKPLSDFEGLNKRINELQSERTTITLELNEAENRLSRLRFWEAVFYSYIAVAGTATVCMPLRELFHGHLDQAFWGAFGLSLYTYFPGVIPVCVINKDMCEVSKKSQALHKKIIIKDGLIAKLLAEKAEAELRKQRVEPADEIAREPKPEDQFLG